MAVTGDRAERLMREVLSRLWPALPPDVRIEIKVGRRMRVTARSNRGVSGFLGRVSLGRTMSPWLPRRVAARAAARDAVRRLLSAAFGDDSYTVRTRVVDDLVHVTFEVPELDGARRRVELEPLPIALCV